MDIIGKAGGRPTSPTTSPAASRSGACITALISFLILAAVVYFFVVVPYTKAKERYFPSREPGTPEDVELLQEIRDLLAPGSRAALTPARPSVVTAQPWCGGTCARSQASPVVARRSSGASGSRSSRSCLGQHVTEHRGEPAAPSLGGGLAVPGLAAHAHEPVRFRSPRLPCRRRTDSAPSRRATLCRRLRAGRPGGADRVAGEPLGQRLVGGDLAPTASSAWGSQETRPRYSGRWSYSHGTVMNWMLSRPMPWN